MVERICKLLMTPTFYRAIALVAYLMFGSLSPIRGVDAASPLGVADAECQSCKPMVAWYCNWCGCFDYCDPASCGG